MMEARSFKRWNAGAAQDLLPPERVHAQVRRVASQKEVVDADFVVLGKAEAQSASSQAFNDNRRPKEKPLRPSGYGVPAAEVTQSVERFLQRASAVSFAVLVMSLAILVFGLCGGFSAFSQPREAGLPKPLHFTHVTATPREANGMPLLVIQGIVENQGQTTQTLAPIRADLLTDSVITASVVIDPPADVLYAGESLGISARIRYPGGKSPEVRLSFMR